MNDEELVKVNALKKRLDGIKKCIEELRKHRTYANDTNYSYGAITINSTTISMELSRSNYCKVLDNMLVAYTEVKDSLQEEYDSYILSKRV